MLVVSFRDDTFDLIRDAFFDHSTRTDKNLGSGLRIRKGFQKSVKITECAGKPQFVLCFVGEYVSNLHVLNIVLFVMNAYALSGQQAVLHGSGCGRIPDLRIGCERSEGTGPHSRARLQEGQRDSQR